MTDERHVPDDELESQRGDLLPDREALSLISADPAGYTAGIDGLASSPSADPVAGTASSTADDAPSWASTDAAASGSGEESVTSADRSEQISQSDSAYSET